MNDNDELITLVGKALKELDDRATVDDDRKLNALYEVEDKIRSCVRTPARVKSEVGTVFKRFGSVSVIAPEIIVSDTKVFAECLMLADNADIYPRTDDTIKIDFGFNQVMIEKEGDVQC